MTSVILRRIALVLVLSSVTGVGHTSASDKYDGSGNRYPDPEEGKRSPTGRNDAYFSGSAAKTWRSDPNEWLDVSAWLDWGAPLAGNWVLFGLLA